jgi:hypothetical protein
LFFQFVEDAPSVPPCLCGVPQKQSGRNTRNVPGTLAAGMDPAQQQVQVLAYRRLHLLVKRKIIKNNLRSDGTRFVPPV